MKSCGTAVKTARLNAIVMGIIIPAHPGNDSTYQVRKKPEALKDL